MGKLAEDDAGDYLSGLLIGAEIAEARRLFPDEEPQIAGGEPLVARYLAAFGALPPPPPLPPHLALAPTRSRHRLG